jgi:adenylate cyclase
VAVDVDSQAKIAPCRLGLSTGRVVVGRIGPRQQLKLGVYGNVVNFGSRLETLGKHFLVPVLMSEATAQAAIEAGSLVRKICYVKPDGFDRAYPVFELVLPQDLGGSGAGSDSIAAYEQALEEFRQRNWVGCLKRLAPLVALDDPPAQWLSMQAASFRAKPPPPGWQGAVENLGK